MAHDKMYGVCENKCLVETISKAEYEEFKVWREQKKAEHDTAIAGKLGKTETAYGAVLDGQGRNIVETYATKDDLINSITGISNLACAVTYSSKYSISYDVDWSVTNLAALKDKTATLRIQAYTECINGQSIDVTKNLTNTDLLSGAYSGSDTHSRDGHAYDWDYCTYWSISVTLTTSDGKVYKKSNSWTK